MASKTSNGQEDERNAVTHRVRHILAVIRSLTVRSAELRGGEAQDYAAHLDGRIAAFARGQMMQLQRPQASFNLEDILREEMLAQAAQEGVQFNISGPSIIVPARVGEVLTLAFHELATNATKFGAFAQPDGKLEVSWDLNPGEPSLVTLLWRETGVKDARQEREGFGLELVTRQAPYEIGGKVDLSFTEDGVVCKLAFPSDARSEKGQQ